MKRTAMKKNSKTEHNVCRHGCAHSAGMVGLVTFFALGAGLLCGPLGCDDKETGTTEAVALEFGWELGDTAEPCAGMVAEVRVTLTDDAQQVVFDEVFDCDAEGATIEDLSTGTFDLRVEATCDGSHIAYAYDSADHAPVEIATTGTVALGTLQLEKLSSVCDLNAFGEGCCTDFTSPTRPDYVCELGSCETGLQCFVIPQGPYELQGVCARDCDNGNCSETGTTCVFDKCLYTCDPPDGACENNLTCRQVNTGGFCLP